MRRPNIRGLECITGMMYHIYDIVDVTCWVTSPTKYTCISYASFLSYNVNNTVQLPMALLMSGISTPGPQHLASDARKLS